MMSNNRVLKMSSDTLIETLSIIFENLFDDRKQRNIVSLFKKGNKQNIKNYHAVSLLLICSKFFKYITYDNTLKIFLDNNSVPPTPSEFKPGGSCLNEFLSHIYDVSISFNNGVEVRDVFLDISIPFDKVRWTYI